MTITHLLDSLADRLPPGLPSPELGQRPVADDLEARLLELEEVAEAGGAAIVLTLILFGCFCALWAQNTGRTGWAWFLLGLFLGPLAALYVLIANAGERRSLRP